MQRTTFNMLGPRPPVCELDKQLVRERLGILEFLDPAVILKTDNTVNIQISKNVYNISSNLEFKTIKTIVDGNKVILPTQNFGIQEILVNLEDDNVYPAFGVVEDFAVTEYNVVFDTIDFSGKLVYIKYLTVRD